MFENKQFTLGKDKFPTWFEDECSKGKARVVYDDEGDLVNVTVYSATKNYVAVEGDTIMLLKSGLAVIPKEQAVKYKVQKEEANE